MKESIFTKVFSYRQRDNISPLENFKTEIFSFCLENDTSFRNDFFSEVLSVKLDKADFNISTQREYENYGRPDIEISSGEIVILFECKVEATERENQLKDYASILTEKKINYSERHIVFLTKYFEHKELSYDRVQLHLVRWFEVYELINETHNSITQQLKSFLKEQKMEKVKNFTVQDLLAMKTIPETITKMDELLEQFKPVFQKHFGGYSKDSSRSTRLPYSLYINFVQLKYQKRDYSLLIGFFWWWGESFEIPYLGLAIEIQKNRFEGSDLISILEKELVSKKGWEIESDGTRVYISAVKPITDFITQQEDNIPTMKRYIESNLNVLLELKKKYPNVLRK